MHTPGFKTLGLRRGRRPAKRTPCRQLGRGGPAHVDVVEEEVLDVGVGGFPAGEGGVQDLSWPGFQQAQSFAQLGAGVDLSTRQALKRDAEFHLKTHLAGNHPRRLQAVRVLNILLLGVADVRGVRIDLAR